MATFYDTHAHLDYPEFAADFAELLARARQAGIVRILSIGTDLESSRRAIALAERHPEIHAVVGWHPTNALEAPEDLRPALLEMARHPRVAGIGETGMDFYRLPSAQPGGTPAQDEPYRRAQERLFTQQLEVAAEARLNVVIHQRAAWDDTLRILTPFAGRLRFVYHCFSEGPDAMRQVIGLGGLVSFTGILTFKNGQSIRDTLAATPADRKAALQSLATDPARRALVEVDQLLETVFRSGRIGG